MNITPASTRTGRRRRAFRRVATVVFGTPLIALALGGIAMTASPWEAEITTLTRDGSDVTIAGTANTPAGEKSGNWMRIDWGDSTVEDLAPFTGSGPWTWGPISHTYATTGTYTITARLLHASPNGQDASQATDTAEVTIPGGNDPIDDEVDVQVALGRCVTDGETSSTPVMATFTGDGSASVAVSDGDSTVATLRPGSTSANLDPGSYTYTVTADEGSVLAETSDTGDTLNVTDCTPSVGAQGSVNVALGRCDSASGTSLTPVTVTIAPQGAASIVITDGASFLEAFEGTGGSIDLEPGDYTWTASVADGFELTGPTAGALTADDCPSIVLGGDPLINGGGNAGSDLPDELAETGLSLPFVLAMALWMAVVGLFVNVLNRRKGEGAGAHSLG